MSIFGSIMSKIFHHGEAEAAPAAQTASAQPSAGAAPENAGRPSAPIASAAHDPAASTTAPAASAPAQVDQAGQKVPQAVAPAGPVDVAAILDGLAAKNSQTLDWKHSIVDMLKLLGLDSSLASRKELAGELHYTGDTGDSATMNVWLHKQVMQKIAENGGTVPDDLKS